MLAGLAAGSFGGCALLDSDSRSADGSPAWRVTPLPMLVRGAENSEGRYALGKYYFYQGQLAKAEKAFLEALRLDPDNAEALNGLGAVYDRRGQPAAALLAYQAALAKAPASPHILANLGYSLQLAGRGAESVTPLRQALAMDPGNVTTRTHLASALGNAPAARSPSPAEVENRQPAAAVQTADAVQAEPLPARLAAVVLLPEKSGRVEVSNGNGVNGLARATSRDLRRDGLKVTRVTNDRPFDKTRTVIVYNARFQATAKALAGSLAVAPLLVAGDVSHRGVDLRVVLGRDLAVASRSPEQGGLKLAALHHPD